MKPKLDKRTGWQSGDGDGTPGGSGTIKAAPFGKGGLGGGGSGGGAPGGALSSVARRRAVTFAAAVGFLLGASLVLTALHPLTARGLRTKLHVTLRVHPPNLPPYLVICCHVARCLETPCHGNSRSGIHPCAALALATSGAATRGHHARPWAHGHWHKACIVCKETTVWTTCYCCAAGWKHHTRGRGHVVG